jgi:hypothetical protein
VEVYFKIFSVAIIAFANNTAIVTTVVALSGRHCRWLPPLPLWWRKRKSTVLHIFISFCFGDEDSEFDGKGDGNQDGNRHGNDLSLPVWWQR